jgi:succinate dehydrogenase/fumarate reductase flavoprotein subunit
MLHQTRRKIMQFNQEEILFCDVLVIGGGGAGLRAAIAAHEAGARVLLTSKSKIGQLSNTFISKGIIAASGLGKTEDNPDAHAADTIKGGRFLNDPFKVAEITRRARSEIGFLQKCGAHFGMNGQELTLLHIAGHRFPRHVFSKTWKGSGIVLPLKKYAQEIGVGFIEDFFVTCLLTLDDCIAGACGITKKGCFLTIQASSVILATGGYAHVFRNTNNVPGITGDGHALCYHIGIPLLDMEFVQFYPTARGRYGSSLLLNERLLAQPGVTLKNSKGEDILIKRGITDFMTVNRDQLAQVMAEEVQEGIVVMDMAALPDDIANQMAALLPASWWKGKKVFPVVPTAHFCMGGVATDAYGKTAMRGLFAVGEVAAGAHGANRLGGNSLAEIFTMGAVAGKAASIGANANSTSSRIGPIAKAEKLRLQNAFSHQGTAPEQMIHDLKEMMWENAGIIRCATGLSKAATMLLSPCPDICVKSPSDLIRYLEFLNLRLVSEMVCMAALKRTESRGSHFRSDFPKEDNEHWLKNLMLQKEASGMQCLEVPIKSD